MKKDGSQAVGGGVPERRLSVRAVGVGDGGCRAVDRLALWNLEGVEHLGLNTDSQALERLRRAQPQLLGRGVMRGLSAGGDPQQGRAAWEADRDRLRAYFKDADLVFLIAGLGGGTGTGVISCLARDVREAGALVLGVVSMPFPFEGRKRCRQARAGLEKFVAEADAVITLSNQTFLSLQEADTSVSEIFEGINDHIAQGVQGIWRMATRPGILNVSFPDLCRAVRGKHSEGGFAFAEARGKNRVREAMKNLLESPFLEKGRLLRESEAVLVNLLGGEDFSMSEVRQMKDLIQRQAEGSQVLVGAALDQRQGETIGVTVVVSRCRRSRPDANALEIEVPGDADQHHEFSVPIAMEDLEAPLARGSTRDPVRSQVPSTRPDSAGGPRSSVGKAARRRRFSRAGRPKLRQGLLKLEAVSKGRFEKSLPTIYHGEDLDIPTFIRRGVAFN